MRKRTQCHASSVVHDVGSPGEDGRKKCDPHIGTGGRCASLLVSQDVILLSLLVVPYCTGRPKFIASAKGEARGPTPQPSVERLHPQITQVSPPQVVLPGNRP